MHERKQREEEEAEKQTEEEKWERQGKVHAGEQDKWHARNTEDKRSNTLLNKFYF